MTKSKKKQNAAKQTEHYLDSVEVNDDGTVTLVHAGTKYDHFRLVEVNHRRVFWTARITNSIGDPTILRLTTEEAGLFLQAMKKIYYGSQEPATAPPTENSTTELDVRLQQMKADLAWMRREQYEGGRSTFYALQAVCIRFENRIREIEQGGVEAYKNLFTSVLEYHEKRKEEQRSKDNG